MTKRWVMILATALLVAEGIAGATSPSAAATATSPSDVKHIVVIVEQSHTYDSYFGAYPRGDGAYTRGARVSQPSSNGLPISSRPLRPGDIARNRPAAGTAALANTGGTSVAAFHGGAMDSFVRAQQRRGKSAQLPLLYADGSSVPGIWGLADSYVLFDRYFSSVPGGSLPNMISMFTGQTRGYSGPSALADLTRFANSSTPTVFDQLTERRVPWRYYVGSLPQLNGDRVIDGSYLKQGAPTPSTLYTAPVLAMPRFWREPLRASLASQDQFYLDASSGKLPAVSVVAPLPSDQPLTALEGAQQRLLSMINSLAKGPEWANTAVFVVWDDWGGWYDHVAPPTTNGLLGFRVPALLVSPLVRQGYISSVPQDHRSVLAFIARRFGLPDLTAGQARGNSFDNVFGRPPSPDKRGVVRLTRLPDPPVGTDRQNVLALATYALVIGTASVAGVLWSVRTRRRQRRPPPSVMDAP